MNLTLAVALDIKPRRCPNVLTVSRDDDGSSDDSSGGARLRAAILGTEDLDVSQIDPASVRLAGVAPQRSRIRDVATPFEPFTGKTAATDCTSAGPDGFDDLRLTFDAKEVADALGAVNPGDVVVVEVTGSLLDGTPIVGEDVVVIGGGDDDDDSS